MTSGAKAVAAPSTRIWATANVYKLSVVLFALQEVGALAALAERAQTAGELAARLGLDESALVPLLDLLVAHATLRRDGPKYLVEPAEARLLPLVALEATRLVGRIQPASVVQTLRGDPPGDPMPSEDSRALWPVYAEAMAVGARSLAPHLARFVRLCAGAAVLDLGGADGTLARCVGRIVRPLQVTVLDREQMRPEFERAQAGGDVESGEFRFVAGDVRDGDVVRKQAGSADVIIASNIMHLLAEDERRALLLAIREGAREGTTLVVYDQFVQPGCTDTASYLVVDWLLCGYRFDGSEQDFGEELARAGFGSVRHRRVAGIPGALVAGTVVGSGMH